MIYLTECDGYKCVAVEADDWQDAERELEIMIANMDVPPQTQIKGELIDEWEVPDGQAIEY